MQKITKNINITLKIDKLVLALLCLQYFWNFLKQISQKVIRYRLDSMGKGSVDESGLIRQWVIR